ncbi:MAG: hypothetical protein HC807_05960 [Gammaproteobacteria bacterium]|nr:hypothetical protein [Gammaproteobacteria bacterium]
MILHFVPADRGAEQTDCVQRADDGRDRAANRAGPHVRVGESNAGEPMTALPTARTSRMMARSAMMMPSITGTRPGSPPRAMNPPAPGMSRPSTAM